MEKVLIDSCVLIEILRGNTEIKNKFLTYNKHFVTFIITMELMQGAINKEVLNKVKKVLNNYYMLPVNEEVANLSIQLIDKYSLSHGLTIPDAIIAATSLIYDVKLFTLNLKDFKFISGIKLL